MKREILKQSWSEKGILHSPENSCLYQFEGRDAKQRQKLTKYNEMHYLGTIFLIDQDTFGFLCTMQGLQYFFYRHLCVYAHIVNF